MYRHSSQARGLGEFMDRFTRSIALESRTRWIKTTMPPIVSSYRSVIRGLSKQKGSRRPLTQNPMSRPRNSLRRIKMLQIWLVKISKENNNSMTLRHPSFTFQAAWPRSKSRAILSILEFLVLF